mmetsp:Transcript_4374/g.17558  ORF Transcript_4374/g.17558 Transcript_4374/m.17558 type:complete len:304 (-) Transcript_4374:943-1854(-)
MAAHITCARAARASMALVVDWRSVAIAYLAPTRLADKRRAVASGAPSGADSNAPRATAPLALTPSRISPLPRPAHVCSAPEVSPLRRRSSASACCRPAPSSAALATVISAQNPSSPTSDSMRSTTPDERDASSEHNSKSKVESTASASPAPSAWWTRARGRGTAFLASTRNVATHSTASASSTSSVGSSPLALALALLPTGGRARRGSPASMPSRMICAASPAHTLSHELVTFGGACTRYLPPPIRGKNPNTSAGCSVPTHATSISRASAKRNCRKSVKAAAARMSAVATETVESPAPSASSS